MKDNRQTSLSILIPTVKFHKYLDQTLESCFRLDLPIETQIIVSVNNTSMDSFANSKFFNDDRIDWKCSYKETVPMHKSWELAIAYAKNDWLFLLSDDDLILEGFLQDIDFSSLSDCSLYMTRINLIDENGSLIKENPQYSKSTYSREEIMEMFFQNQIHDHLSLLVFHKNLYRKIGHFSFAGYPNGYFIDTIFHGKAYANCDKVITATDTVFSRRESLSQQSAKFYLGKEVNSYFKIITDAMFEDDNLAEEILRRYKTKKSYYIKQLSHRFYIEWGKLNNPVYKKNILFKIQFLYKFIRFWDLSTGFKIMGLCYAMVYKLKHLMPKSIIQFLKKRR